jgi:peptide/nickel transport system permease protein
MALPVLASCYASFAGISRFMRTSMLENLRLDYVRTARAKGLAERVVVLRHVLRNSLIPIVTILASLLPGLIAGSVFIETIFTIPGVGYLAFQSVLVRDYPMVMAIFTIGSTLSLVGILLADILLTVVDPRIQFSEIQG